MQTFRSTTYSDAANAESREPHSVNWRVIVPLLG